MRDDVHVDNAAIHYDVHLDNAGTH